MTSIGLIKLGHSVDLLCLENSPMARKADGKIKNVLTVKNQLNATLRLASSAKNYDIIHAQSARAFGCAALSSYLHQTPIVFTRRVEFIPRGRLTRLKYSRASAVAAISPAISQILEKFGIERVPVISSIVEEVKGDEQRARNILAQKGVHCDRNVIGVVAALTGEKDPFTMIKAARELRKKGTDALFLHFGDGPLKSEMLNLIGEYNLINNYTLMGHLENITDFFSCFDLFAMSSRFEGLGSSVLDAFLHKVPVASTSAGGLKDLVQGRGLLSDPGDAFALAHNMGFLLNNPQKASEYANVAYDYVVENHSMSTIARSYSQLYQKVIGQA